MLNDSINAHSMNGIITLSDGMGTTIENGTITTNTINVGNIITPSLTALYGNVLVLQGNIVNTTTQVNNLYGNVVGIQSQIPPIYGNVLVLQNKEVLMYGNVSLLQGNIVNTTTQVNSLYGNVSVLQGNIVNTTTQVNNLYGNVSVVQSQIPPIASNITLLQTKTTAISYIPTTTTISSNISIQGNVITNGQIDASNIAVSGFGAVSNTFSVGDNLGVGSNIVNSGHIFSGGNHSCNTLITQNLLVNNTIINGNTQAQINNIHNIINPLFKPVYNTIDPSGLTIYYPFSISQYFNLSTLHPDGIRVGNMATGSLVYDASLTGISRMENNSLVSFHTRTLPVGQHGLVINRTITPPTGGMCISFWFVATSIPVADYYLIYTIQNTLGFPSGTRFYITINPQNKIVVSGPGNNDITGLTTIIVGTRYHIVYNYTTAGAGTLYINNVVDNFQASNAPVIATNNSGFNSIARDPAGNGLIGTVDDLRHYINTTLSLTQIATLFSLPPY